MKYKYFQVNQKLGAPVMSQPANPPNPRKASAESTQSDSKLIITSKKPNVAKILPAKFDKDSCSPDGSSGSNKISPAKDGSDRLINRNLPLSKTGMM